MQQLLKRFTSLLSAINDAEPTFLMLQGETRWRESRGRETRGRESRGRETRWRESRGRETRWRVEEITQLGDSASGLAMCGLLLAMVDGG